jgi:hypothetical protein
VQNISAVRQFSVYVEVLELMVSKLFPTYERQVFLLDPELIA